MRVVYCVWVVRHVVRARNAVCVFVCVCVESCCKVTQEEDEQNIRVECMWKSLPDVDQHSSPLPSFENAALVNLVLYARRGNRRKCPARRMYLRMNFA